MDRTMRSNECPLCGEGWPEQHDWITDEMMDQAWGWLDANCPAEGPALRVIDKADMRAAFEAALSAARHE
jgi:hypothetical protein